jgi:hypothetical protein
MFLNPFRNVFVALFLIVTSSCGTTPTDGSTPLSVQAQIDAANIALTQGNCNAAYVALYPVYNSQYTSNDVRTIMSSVYACSAGINLISLINSIAQNSSVLSGSGFWALLAELFPSTFTDVVPESAEYATDAIFATLYPGQIVSAANTTNAGTYNPGSVIAANRIPDANSYLTFVSMAAIGGLENRYGLPTAPTYNKTQNLPWVTASTSGMKGDGCGFSASILNFFDGIEAIGNNLSGNSLTSNLNTVYSTFNTILNAACALGCQGLPAPYDLSFASGCSFTAAQCSACPLTLRNRASCSGQTSDMNSCAAAGLIDFINKSPLGWQ